MPGGSAALNDGEDRAFAAPRAGSCGRGGIGLGRGTKLLFRFAHPFCGKFKSRVTVVADVVETTLGFAGVDDVLGAALGTSNDK